MRAVWLSVAWVVACGGRTLGDPSFDEPLGSGGSVATASGGHVTATSGGNPIATGGRPAATGGTPATGGRPTAAGGTVAVTGGRPATGGTGTGGTTEAPAKVCAPFCKALVAVCGKVISSNFDACASQCVVDIGGLSSSCAQARHDALACVQKTLSQPMASCDDMPRILQFDCAVPLARSAFCHDP